MSKLEQIEAGGTKVHVGNLDKVFYPATGFTKGEVIDYYARISPVLLPHLRGRPITLKRYPNGVEGGFFYEKNCPSHRPDWVGTAPMPRTEGGVITYCVLNDLPSLIWAANLADLELHTFLHKAPAVERPTAVAFDLDPGPPADVLLCCQVALRLKAALAALGLKSFPKTSGSKGLQVYVPLNSAATYEKTKAFAHALADHLAQESPETVVSSMSKERRGGKVFIDWSQNDRHKTTINVYSLRARAHPFVSTPLTWAEVETAVRRAKAGLLGFEAGEAIRRVHEFGDLFAPVLTLKQSLPALTAVRQKLAVAADSAAEFRSTKTKSTSKER